MKKIKIIKVLISILKNMVHFRIAKTIFEVQSKENWSNFFTCSLWTWDIRNNHQNYTFLKDITEQKFLQKKYILNHRKKLFVNYELFQKVIQLLSRKNRFWKLISQYDSLKYFFIHSYIHGIQFSIHLFFFLINSFILYSIIIHWLIHLYDESQ